MVALLAFALPSASSAQRPTPELRIEANGELNFGIFMVFGSGARSVSAAGAVIDQSIVALEGSQARPASFTIEYQRGTGANPPAEVTVELVFSAPAQIRTNGVEARLSAYETDLPGYGRVSPGQAILIRLPNCRARRCSRSFNLGARLDITRHFGGAKIVVPIDLDARIVATGNP